LRAPFPAVGNGSGVGQEYDGRGTEWTRDAKRKAKQTTGQREEVGGSPRSGDWLRQGGFYGPPANQGEGDEIARKV